LDKLLIFIMHIDCVLITAI